MAGSGSQAELGNNMKFVSETFDLDLGFATTLLHVYYD